MTDPTPALAAALAKVQAELPKLERDRTVTVTQKSGDTYSYSYATLANLSDAVLPLLAKHGLSFLARPGTGSDGKMCLRYSLMHESGEEKAGEFPISGEGGIQMIGGRITYARRYCLAAVTGIAADEDDEARLSDDAGRGTAQRAPRARSTSAASDGPAASAQRAARPRAAPPPPLPGEPADGVRGITSPQSRNLHRLLGATDRGDRDVGLVYIARVIGREVTSTKELTMPEARLVIDALMVETGEGGSS
jgi:hypothetical protein